MRILVTDETTELEGKGIELMTGLSMIVRGLKNLDYQKK